MAFTTKITHVRFTISPFSPESMMGIGQVMLNTKKDRISRAINSTDSPAKALSPRYLAEKTGSDGKGGRRVTGSGTGRYRGTDLRDWKLRGWTMASAKVLSASQDRVTIGFINPQSDKIVTSLRRMDEMWSDSPNDTLVFNAIFRETLRSQVQVIRTVTVRKSAA